MGVTYWSILILLFGACVGSFLNVIIYRWSHDLSVLRPLRSFCPSCGHAIAWYDNIPIISYLLLGGRCRHCKTNISWQYPAVEAATALAFLVTYDAFFVSKERLGIGSAGSIDSVMFIAHCILWAGLIAVTVMDLETYTLDITITWIVLIAGLIANTFWTPVASVQPDTWIRPGAFGAALAVAGCLGLILGMWIFLREPPLDEHEPEPEKAKEEIHGEPGVSEEDAADAKPEMDLSPPTPPPGRRVWPIIATLVIIALLALYVTRLATTRPDRPLSWQYGLPTRTNEFTFSDHPPPLDNDWQRLLIVAGVLFVGLSLVASHPHAEADEEIVDTVEAEAVTARRLVLEELVLLSPAMLLILAVILLFRFVPGLGQHAMAVLHWTPWDHWQPVLGFSTGLFGCFVGVVLGWGTRITATLAFGKEGLGMGDVHILAAAGAVAGWPVVVLGFFLAAPTALLALPVIRLRRQSMMVPYGPWLAFGFFLAAIFQERILWFLNIRRFLE